MPATSGSEILAVIEEICKFGPRWMGSPGAERTVDFIAAQFEASGLAVERQAFRYLAYTPGKAAVSINGRGLACEPIALARPTTEVLKAPLVMAGQCLPADLAALKAKGRKIEGSIIVSENLRSFVAYPFAESAGAVGLLSLSTLPGNIIRCGSARLDRKPGKIPAVAIGGDDSRWIAAELAKDRRLEVVLEAGGQFSEKQGCNVVGRRGDPAADRVLVTAHYDSFWNGVHAMDNAAGSATVITFSRMLSAASKQAFEFVVFGGEESGFWGSSSYVMAPNASLETIKAVVNFDTFGSNRSQVEIGATSDLAEICRRIAQKQGIKVDCWNIPPRPASDQHCFVEKGVPAIWLANCGADQRYHTPLDVPSEMSPEKLEISARLAMEFIQELTGIQV